MSAADDTRLRLPLQVLLEFGIRDQDVPLEGLGKRHAAADIAQQVDDRGGPGLVEERADRDGAFRVCERRVGRRQPGERSFEFR